ncbi:transcriptional regulator [Kribbella qitaiheensis]|uniref:Transcriptional regulator n=1 Tax=Kribbella qitaiheensis TaxID=1544730 RepID=A0A7G6X209_9ACTN|nr:helix-turn-helix domain-containing protein [Kribbella qitaiheensis]QNE20274.1 transcriptional regulator [Kribbella qitaiheensis]
MTTKTYGQYCGVARALELVGERWALLIIRDLLVGPKRYTDLRAGLPKIPTNVLATRLKELERAGIVVRRIQPRPSGAIVYELTEYGADLDEVVLAMGRWGARSLGELRPDEIITPDILVMALRSTFQPGNRKAKYELRFGEIVVHAVVDGDSLEVAPGPLPKADLVVEAFAPLSPLLSGELDAKQALANGIVRTDGSIAALTRFATHFHIAPHPAPER